MPPSGEGARLGPYVLGASLGSGGMGEVFRARDTRLGRDVAIKILPAEVAGDADRLRRFEQEARAAAALNHPNIMSVHDVGHVNGVAYLVTELLEGHTLRTALAQPLSIERALDYAPQIADGLAAAHARGIVHRDIKPENLFVTSDGCIKILDFGLAKVISPDVALADIDATALSPADTASGMILGTVGYIAPEQIRGLAVDARADIFAFGCVFYEMLAGRRAFEGDTAVDTISAILKDAPAPLASAPPRASIPPAIARIVLRCLEKIPDARFQTASDLAFALRSVAPEVASPASTAHSGAPGLRRARALALVLFLSLAGLLAWLALMRAAPAEPVSPARISLSLARDASLTLEYGLAISPDGQTLAFAARDSEGARLYIRRLDEWEPRALPDTDSAFHPFFSPDGLWLAFWQDGALKKMPVAGGRPQVICTMAEDSIGRWQTGGTIVVAGALRSEGIWRVSAEGGSPQSVLRPDEQSDVQYMWPEPLPGGGLLFTILKDNETSVAVLPRAATEPRVLVESGGHARYLPTGHLAYVADSRLMVAPFDLERLEMRGPATALADDLYEDRGSSYYEVSSTGVLAYLPRASVMSTIVWKDRRGVTTPALPQPRAYGSLRLSPDGERLSVRIEAGASRSIWAGAVADEPLTRLTASNDAWFGLWSPDGRHLFHTAFVDGSYNVFSTATDGSGKTERLTHSRNWQAATSVSPDGKTLLYHDIDNAGGTGTDIWELALASREVRAVVQTPFHEYDASFSPDGRWISYTSQETGREEVYVQAYPGPGMKRQVSSDGGGTSSWSRSGRELFYQTASALFAVPILEGPSFRTGKPVQLFSLSGTIGEASISADGRRFLILEAKPLAPQLNLVLDWFDDVKARVK